MKNMKKILALVLAMLLVVGSVAFASTVTNATDHTYNIYQVFSGTQAAEAGKTALGDVEWGTGINASAFLTALKADDRFKVSGTNIFAAIANNDTKAAEKVAKALGDNNTADIAKAFANVADQNHSATVFATVTGNATTPDLPAGYYLFVDSSTIGDNDAANTALLQITNKSEGLKIEKKYDVPSLDKDIVDSTLGHIEAADYNIGETVHYEMKGTLPSNYSDYEKYYYTFHDTLSAGQAFQADVSVSVKNGDADEVDVTSYFTSSQTTATDGASALTFTVGIDDLKTIPSSTVVINSDSVIYVRYSAVITADAVIGSTGNQNEGWLEFSNNPNKDHDGEKTTTPHDYNLVFTFDLKPTKVDKDNSATKLPGAQFVLKATSGEHTGKWVQIDAATKKLTGWLDSEPGVLTTIPATGNTGVLVSDASGNFEVYGLDAGTYELKEIKAPEGYNLLTETIAIEITAEITGDATATHDTDTPALDSLKIKIGDHQDTTDYKSTGILPATVENGQGSTLPSTGGIGTTLFYVGGGILVLAAVILLVTKKRMSAND